MIEQAAYTVLFYLFAAIMLAMAIGVVVGRKMLRAAMCLMVVLLISAVMYVMLRAYFLAGIQVLVYVGGIVVLIVFAVMLTQSGQGEFENATFVRRLIAAAGAAAFILAGTFAILNSSFKTSTAAATGDNTAAIGLKLLDVGSNGYILPFEIISVLLLAAAVGAIVIARKTPPKDQPFTSGGDLPGEADVVIPNSQRPTPPSSAEAHRS